MTTQYRATYGAYTPPAGPTAEQLEARANGVPPVYVLWSMTGGAVQLGHYPTVEDAEATMFRVTPSIRTRGVRVEEGEHVLYVYAGNPTTVLYAIERGYRS